MSDSGIPWGKTWSPLRPLNKTKKETNMYELNYFLTSIRPGTGWASAKA